MFLFFSVFSFSPLFGMYVFQWKLFARMGIHPANLPLPVVFLQPKDFAQFHLQTSSQPVAETLTIMGLCWGALRRALRYPGRKSWIISLD